MNIANVIRYEQSKDIDQIERRGSERERDEESMRERNRWGSEWLRERGRLLKREREREKRGEHVNREGKGKSLKNRCAKIVCLQ